MQPAIAETSIVLAALVFCVSVLLSLLCIRVIQSLTPYFIKDTSPDIVNNILTYVVIVMGISTIVCFITAAASLFVMLDPDLWICARAYICS